MNLPVSYIYDESGQPTSSPTLTSQPKGHNICGVSVFIYPHQFIIDPNTHITGLKSRLVIDRTTGKFQQREKSQPITAPQRKMDFSVFLGVLPVFNCSFLVFAEYVKEPIVMEKHDIFEVVGLAYIPLGNEREYERQDKWQSILNYLSYLKTSIMREGYYFSFTYDLSVSKIKQAEGYPKNFKFCWNAYMARGMVSISEKEWMVSLIQGFLRGFAVNLQGKKVEYFLISRRSWRKGGTRYYSRGIGDKGNVANHVETEQIIYLDNYCCSHLQIRGSVPAFWKQTGVSATVQFYENRENTLAAFRKHFSKLREVYDNILCVNLLAANKPQQHQLTLYFEELIKQQSLKCVRYEYFDFHEACKNQRFDKANILIGKIGKVNEYFKFYAEDLTSNKVVLTQRGVMRTNCLDCLDRTNFVQTKLAVHILEVMLNQLGIDVSKRGIGYQSLVEALDDAQSVDPLVISLKNIWADNGDAISVHYTGTGSTHTNITRTGKRDFRGMMQHGLKTITRFYQQNIEDSYKQQVIDLLIGEHTETINQSEFETRMQSMAIWNAAEMETKEETAEDL